MRINEFLKDKFLKLHIENSISNLLLRDLFEHKNEIKESLQFNQVWNRGNSHMNGSHILPEMRNLINTKIKLIKTWIKGLTDQSSQQKSLSVSELERMRVILNNYFDYSQARMELIADVINQTENRFHFNVSVLNLIQSIKPYFNNIAKGLIDSLSKKDVFIHLDEIIEVDQELSFANFELGISCMLLIIENVIRNYYKHKEHKVHQTDFEFVIKFSEPDIPELAKDLIQVEFVDLHGHENQSQRRQNNSDGTKLVLNSIRDYLNNPITDEKIEIRRGGWGFIEMLAASQYLIGKYVSLFDRGQSPSSPKIKPLEANYYKAIYSNENQIDNIEAKSDLEIEVLEREFYQNSLEIDSKTNTDLQPHKLDFYNLGYKFYIPKAKEILIDESILTDSQKSNYHSCLRLTDGIENTKYLRTEFDLFITNKFTTNSNQRILNLDAIDIDISSKNTKEELWDKYSKQISSKNVKIYQPNTNTNYSNSIPLIIDDHGMNYNSYKSEAINYNVPYFYSSSNFNKALKNNILGSEKIERGLEEVQLKESLLSKVLVLDERIQKALDYRDHFPNDMTMRDLWDDSWVHVPDTQDLDLDNYLKDSIEAYLKKYNNVDYILLHFTIFKKLADHAIENVNDFFSYFFDKVIRIPNAESKIIFCTAMGRPPELIKTEYKTVNLSSVQRILVKNPCKITFMNLLKSL